MNVLLALSVSVTSVALAGSLEATTASEIGIDADALVTIESSLDTEADAFAEADVDADKYDPNVYYGRRRRQPRSRPSSNTGTSKREPTKQWSGSRKQPAWNSGSTKKSAWSPNSSSKPAWNAGSSSNTKSSSNNSYSRSSRDAPARSSRGLGSSRYGSSRSSAYQRPRQQPKKPYCPVREMIAHEAEIRVQVEELKKQYNYMLKDSHVLGDYIDYIKTSMDATTANINKDLQ